MSSKLRIVGYGRESTKEQARYGFNLDDQEKKIYSYVDSEPNNQQNVPNRKQNIHFDPWMDEWYGSGPWWKKW